MGAIKRFFGIGLPKEDPPPRRPEKPMGCRLEYADGTVVPIELEYYGVDYAGMTIWVTEEVPFGGAPWPVVKVGVLPPRTVIHLRTSGRYGAGESE